VDHNQSPLCDKAERRSSQLLPLPPVLKLEYSRIIRCMTRESKSLAQFLFLSRIFSFLCVLDCASKEIVSVVHHSSHGILWEAFERMQQLQTAEDPSEWLLIFIVPSHAARFAFGYAGRRMLNNIQDNSGPEMRGNGN
jgi:hypothetical protein